MSSRGAFPSASMGQPRPAHYSLLALLIALCLISAQAQSDRFGSSDYPGASGAGPAGSTTESAAGEADGDVIQATGEFDLGEEQPGEGGEGFMDLGAAIGNKAPPVSSVGSAAVASGFNFTKAAEMRAAAAARMQGNATQAQPGALLGKTAAGTAAQTEAAGAHAAAAAGSTQAGAGAIAVIAAGGGAAGLPGSPPGQPGVTDLARNAAIANANVASNLAALGMPTDVPGVRTDELTDGSLKDHRSVTEASVLPGGGQDPRMELGAGANVSQVAPTNFKGAEHTAKHQARHYKALPGTISEECTARLIRLVSNGLAGQAYVAGSLGELLGNVSVLMLQKGERQMDAGLASILSGSTSTWIDFHLRYMTNNYEECKKSTTLPALKACLLASKRQLRHSEIMWFDEAFLAALMQRLGDVRSMFGFGSGRGDFERWFYEQGVAYTYGLEPGFLGTIGFYAPGWEYREGPVQLTGLLMNDTGMQELEDFRCYMTGNAHYQVDLVQSFETFEEIPREEHCDLINVLAGMASRWIAVTMGQLGQGGGHHIANRHKEDFLSEWTTRGLVYRGDLTASIKEDCYMCQLHYLRYNLLIFEVDPSRVVPVDCEAESAAEWAPYENYVEQLVYLPNGTASPSKLHEKQYHDWEYVVGLKSG